MQLKEIRKWAEANWPSGGIADERKEIGERSRVRAPLKAGQIFLS